MNLAVRDMLAAGRLQDALRGAKQAIDLAYKYLPEDSLCYAHALNNLAECYRTFGSLSDAEPLYHAAIDSYRLAVGERHPAFAAALNNLAGLRQAQGQFVFAEPLFKQAAEIDRQALGDRHPEFALDLNNLAVLYQEMGKFTESQELAERSFSIRRLSLPDNHPDLAQSMNLLGLTHSLLGNYSMAEDYYRRALLIVRTVMGAGSFFHALILANLSDLHADMGRYLGDLRRDGLSVQTYNHYLKAARSFTRWLVRDRRSPFDPLVHVSRLNVRTDRRHDRRALSADEFTRLVEAAWEGRSVENISGPDRVMMYILAAWTGFRKGEIGSLTLRSLRLEDDPPTATVEACYSKHRRADTQVLHPALVSQLRDWLAGKSHLTADQPLFPVSGRVPGGKERKTHKMIERDLMAARDQWLNEAKTDAERLERMRSDFLCYCDHDGLFADFHGLRHLFISSLERAGVKPKMAQTLARHSDIRLTLGVYTHVELHDQTAAIEALPPPPNVKGSRDDDGEVELGLVG